MTDQDVWREYAAGLLSKLTSGGLVDSAELESAFWAVPRHRYIDDLYLYGPGIPSWRQQARPQQPEADRDWLERVYADQSLAVRVSGESDLPSCLNSQPSLVFWLLRCLGLRHGDRVLDVGTGTGQLAALLSRLAGDDGEVVSLEVDPGLAAAARSRLAALLPDARLSVVGADAADWQAPDGEFSALVATASCWPVPLGWFTVLAPGGRACVELRGQLGGGLLLAQRPARGQTEMLATGTFAERVVGFLPLGGVARQGPPLLSASVEGEELGRIAADGLGFTQLTGTPFSWYCQLEIPDVQLVGLGVEAGAPQIFLAADYGLDAVRLPADGNAPGSQIAAYGGTSDLLKRVTAAWQQWQEYGQPGLASYVFSADPSGNQRVELTGAGKSWELGEVELGLADGGGWD